MDRNVFFFFRAYVYFLLFFASSLKAVCVSDVQFIDGDLTDSVIICLSESTPCIYQPTPLYKSNQADMVFEFFLPDVVMTPTSKALVKKFKARNIEDFSIDFLFGKGSQEGLKIIVKVDTEKVSWTHRIDRALGGRTIGFFFTDKDELSRIKSSAQGLRWVA